MPIYEYECTNCRFCFERKQRFDDEPITTCPRCQGKAHRVLHSVPVIFKGSGFYVTDNRKGSPVSDAPAPKDGSEKKTEVAAKKESDVAASKKNEGANTTS